MSLLSTGFTSMMGVPFRASSTRSSDRPNPIGLHDVVITAVDGRRLQCDILLSGAVTSRMHCEHVPTSAIEPGDKNQFIARSDALQPFEDFRFEHQPRCRRAFVGLSGGRFWLCQRRFHLTDRRHRETRHDASLGCSRCRIHQVPASTFLVVQRFRLFAQSQVALAFDQRDARLASR
jgi:hypothetical protein